MENHKLLLCFVLLGLAWACFADVAQEFNEVLDVLEVRQNIPPRCIQKSVTEVSCEAVGADAMMPHPDDCRLFYQCVGDVPVCRQCPAALHFNPDKHVCDYAVRAGCRARAGARAA